MGCMFCAITLPPGYLPKPLLPDLTEHLVEAFEENSLSTCLQEQTNTLHWNTKLNQVFLVSTEAESLLLFGFTVLKEQMRYVRKNGKCIRNFSWET
jgi:hypothetical protein